MGGSEDLTRRCIDCVKRKRPSLRSPAFRWNEKDRPCVPQAQRVAIARALLSSAPILLLDEATSALDEPTEAKLLENIGAMRDKTVLIVTHRRAALAICDYTLHIENGQMTKL